MCIQAMFGAQMMHHHRHVSLSGSCCTRDPRISPQAQEDELQVNVWLTDSAVIKHPPINITFYCQNMGQYTQEGSRQMLSK